MATDEDRKDYPLGVPDFDAVSVDNSIFESLQPGDVTNAEPGAGTVVAYAFRGYIGAWLSYLLGAAFVSLICNGLFHIPLWQVVDVNLSFFLFLVGVQILLAAFGLVVDATEGDWLFALYRIVQSALWALLPFASICGFMIYGYFGNETIATQSFVYDGYVGMFAKGYQALAGSIGDFLGAITTSEDAAGTKTSSVDVYWLAQVATVGSFLLGVVDRIISRLRA
jgi:hypothetical protein